MYKEYLAEFWYSAIALDNSKVSFSIPFGGIYGKVGVNTFRNAIGAHYLPYSSEYVAPPSIDIVRPWFETIGYGETVPAKGTLKKSMLPPRWSLVARQIKEEASNTIKLKDLEKLVSQVQRSFKDPNLPEDDPVIIVDDSDEDVEDEIHTIENFVTGDYLVPKSSSPRSLIKCHKSFEQVCSGSSQPEGEHIKKDKGKKAMSSKDAKEVSTKSNSDDETTYVPGFMVESSKKKDLKKFDFVTKDGEHVHLTKEQINAQKKRKEEAKAETTRRESETRKEELIDLFGPEVVNKYYNDKLQYDGYCDKMLNRRTKSRIINCDILTRKGPITLKVYREDDTSEIIPKFKDSNLHLGE
nr:hypothetical protein [Tanacetum cinerariifolium]